jgi:hypothetical protein
MIAEIPSGTFQIPDYALWMIAGWVLSTLLAGWTGYRWALRTKTLEREWNIQDAKTARRGELIQFANLVKNTINTSNSNPADWVNFFKDIAVQFLTIHGKTSGELTGDEKRRIDEAMKVIARFASMNHGDIYEHQQELFNALNRIPGI